MIGRLLRWLAGRHLPEHLAVLAVLLLLPAAWMGLAADDHHFRMALQGFPGLPELAGDRLDPFTFADGDPARNRAAMERGLLPWWTPPDFKLAFFRPLATATHALDQALWPDSSIAAHLHSTAWFALLAWVVARFYRRTVAGGWTAGLAAVMFVADDSRVATAGWIASRNLVLCCLASVLALWAHDRRRREGWRAGAVIAPACLGLGLLCSEAALGAAAYLAAYAAFVDPDAPRRRILALLPHAAVVLSWTVVHALLGYGAEGSGLYLDPSRHPLLFVAAAARHLPLQLMGLFAGINPFWWVLAPDPWATLHWLAALTFVALAAWAAWPLLRRDPWARFWAVSTVLSLVPACGVAPQTRVLIIPAIGGMALVALFLQAWTGRLGALRATPARRVATAGLAWITIVTLTITGPLTGFSACAAPALFGYQIGRAALSLPADPALAGQRVIVTGLPSDIVLHGIPYMRSSLRWPSPRQLQALHAGIGAVELHRVDASTLDVRAEDSFVARPWAQMFRGVRTHPFSVGQTVELDGLRIEILEVDGAGRAVAARFRFDGPLETAVDHWLAWSASGLVPFSPPPPGVSVRIDGQGIVEYLRATRRSFFASGAWRHLHALNLGPLPAPR